MRELNQTEGFQISGGIINPTSIIVGTALVKAGAKKAESYVKSGRLLEDLKDLASAPQL